MPKPGYTFMLIIRIFVIIVNRTRFLNNYIKMRCRCKELSGAIEELNMPILNEANTPTFTIVRRNKIKPSFICLT